MADEISIDFEAMLDDYALSAPYGAVKVGEHWIREGKDVEEAAEIATNYALSEIVASGADKQRLVLRLNRMRIVVDAIMDAVVERYELRDPRATNDTTNTSESDSV